MRCMAVCSTLLTKFLGAGAIQASHEVCAFVPRDAALIQARVFVWWSRRIHARWWCPPRIPIAIIDTALRRWLLLRLSLLLGCVHRGRAQQICERLHELLRLTINILPLPLLRPTLPSL